VFFPGNLVEAAQFVGSFRPAARQRLRFLGTASWDLPNELARSRTALDGAIFVTPFLLTSSDPVISRFVTAYSERYGRKPDFLAAQGFDAATLALAALRRQRVQNISFEQAFQSIQTYDGLTGLISVRPGGELQRRFSVVQLLGENLVSPPPLERIYDGTFEAQLNTEVVEEQEEQKQVPQYAEPQTLGAERKAHNF
ncbi:MAG: ABC transporter substrate-binding protein, partial [Bdellovibrionales bacterium]|nr:ABC transporter substrate-binding protein [Bdellovibrionales bacterium]